VFSDSIATYSRAGGALWKVDEVSFWMFFNLAVVPGQMIFASAVNVGGVLNWLISSCCVVMLVKPGWLSVSGIC